MFIRTMHTVLQQRSEMDLSGLLLLFTDWVIDVQFQWLWNIRGRDNYNTTKRRFLRALYLHKTPLLTRVQVAAKRRFLRASLNARKKRAFKDHRERRFLKTQFWREKRRFLRRFIIHVPLMWRFMAPFACHKSIECYASQASHIHHTPVLAQAGNKNRLGS